MISLTIQCIMFSIPAILHLLSIYVLYLAKDSRLQATQRLYLIHLSISEFLTCFLGIVKRIGKIYNYKYFAFQVHICQAGVATFVYYFVMICLTLDRFFEVRLNIRYPIHWTERKTKFVIAVIWIGSGGFTCFLYITQTTSSNINDTILIYFYPIFGIICVVVAIVTYGYIGKKIYLNTIIFSNRVGSAPVSEASNRHDIHSRNGMAITSLGSVKIVKNNFYKRVAKGLYLPALLILTFAIFIVIPELVYFYTSFLDITLSEEIRTILTLSYFIAFTSDVLIYVFGSKTIRGTFLQRFPYLDYHKAPMSQRTLTVNS